MLSANRRGVLEKPITETRSFSVNNPANPAQYRTPDGWADFQTREEVIKVKGQADEKLVVRSTRHGPVMSYTGTSQAEVMDTRKFVLALRWSALDADNQTVAAGIRANFAQTTEALLSAFSAYHSPMQNLVAADTTGRTAYKAIGRVPQRRADNDIRGVAPSPGWEARYDWQGWMGADQAPGVGHDAIAAKGWHATANQRIHAPDYPYFLGQDCRRLSGMTASRPCWLRGRGTRQRACLPSRPTRCRSPPSACCPCCVPP